MPGALQVVRATWSLRGVRLGLLESDSNSVRPRSQPYLPTSGWREATQARKARSRLGSSPFSPGLAGVSAPHKWSAPRGVRLGLLKSDSNSRRGPATLGRACHIRRVDEERAMSRGGCGAFFRRVDEDLPHWGERAILGGSTRREQ
eukprot:1603605-Prymnesium_polylepis.1